MTTVKEAGLATIDMKLEVIVIPVSDAERAEQFYRKLGWRQDVTPPGSGVFQFSRCSRIRRRSQDPGLPCPEHLPTRVAWKM